MTTTDAGTSVSADFPITWDDPADQQATWLQDVMHTPLPVTPLAGTLFQPAFAEGTSRRFAQLSMPVDGLRVSVQNGYVYLSPTPVIAEPEVLEARFAEMQRLNLELASTVLKDWRETFEPQVLERVDRILGFDYDGSSAQAVAQFVTECRKNLVDVWDIHMRVNIPPMNAVFGLEDILTQALGEDVARKSRLLLQGYDNKSVETGKALWSLSRWIRSADGLADAVRASRARNGAVELGDNPHAAEFGDRWREFLRVYGWRSDRFMEIAQKSWHEDPSTPLIQLKGYLALDDAQDPFAGHAKHAEQRDRLAAEIEAQLPDELRPVFRMILPAAQQYIPIAEDHNFTIDQKFTAVVRHAIVQLGGKLVADGTLNDAEDVFYLDYDEVTRIANGETPSGLEASVRQRRREHIRQATLQAPPMIGTPPPEDAPPDPLVSKFFGFGLIPSEEAGVVTGHPCSPGAVTGIAKVVPTLDDAHKIEPGDVLVCRATMPAWTPLFGVVSAVVADAGGPLSHCAIVAREYSIPCVAGTVNGTSVLRDGQRVRVDGNTGTVTVLSDSARG